MAHAPIADEIAVTSIHEGREGTGRESVDPPLSAELRRRHEPGMRKSPRGRPNKPKVRTCGASRTEQDDQCNYLSAGGKLTRNVTQFGREASLRIGNRPNRSRVKCSTNKNKIPNNKNMIYENSEYNIRDNNII
jgi:hypothetical protein